MDNKRLIEKLNGMVLECGSQKALAEKLGVSQQYLNDVLRGRRDVGDKILFPLGLKRVISYEKR